MSVLFQKSYAVLHSGNESGTNIRYNMTIVVDHYLSVVKTAIWSEDNKSVEIHTLTIGDTSGRGIVSIYIYIYVQGYCLIPSITITLFTSIYNLSTYSHYCVIIYLTN